MNTLILHRATLKCHHILLAQRPSTTSKGGTRVSYEHPNPPPDHHHHHATLSDSRDDKKWQEPEMSSIIFTFFLLKDQLHQQSGIRASCEHSNPPLPDYHHHHHHDASLSGYRDIKKCQEPELIHRFHILLAQRSTTSMSPPPRILVYTAMKQELSQNTTATTTPPYPDPETSRNAKNSKSHPSFSHPSCSNINEPTTTNPSLYS